MWNFFTGPFLFWLPRIVYFLILIAAIGCFWYQKPYIKKLIWLTLAFQIVYTLLLSGLQYYVWSQNPLTKILLSLPPDSTNHKLGYFVFYIWGRFWLRIVIAWLIAFLFYGFLKLLNRYKTDSFSNQEIGLCLLLNLIIGWPNLIVFLSLTFILLIIFSLYRSWMLQQASTTVGWPLLWAAAVTMLFGAKIINLLHLTTLRI